MKPLTEWESITEGEYYLLFRSIWADHLAGRNRLAVRYDDNRPFTLYVVTLDGVDVLVNRTVDGQERYFKRSGYNQ